MPTALLALPEFLDWLEPGRPLLLQAEAEGALRLEEAPTITTTLMRWAARATREGGRWQVIIVAPEAILLDKQADLLDALATEASARLATVTLLPYAATPDTNLEPVERFHAFLASANPTQQRRVVRTEKLFRPEVLAPLEAAYLIVALTRTELPHTGEFVLRRVTLNRDAFASMVSGYRRALTAEEQRLRNQERRQPVPEYEDRSRVEPYLLPGTSMELLQHPEGSRDNTPDQGISQTVLPQGWLKRGADAQAVWERWQEANIRELDRQAVMLHHHQRAQLEGKLAENADRLEREGTSASKALTRTEIDKALAGSADARAKLATSQPLESGPAPLNARRWQHLRQDYLTAAARRPQPWNAVFAPLVAAVLLLPALPLEGRAGWTVAVLALMGVITTRIVTAQRIRGAFRRSRKAATDAVRDQLTHLANLSKQGKEHLEQQLRLWHLEQNAHLLEDAARDLRAQSRLLEWHESIVRKRLTTSEPLARTLPETPTENRPPRSGLDPALNEASNALYRLSSYAPTARKEAQLYAEAARRLLEGPEFAGLSRIDLEACATSPERDEPNP